MRVTMIGISGAGKTTYMAGLAQQMSQGTVEGYTISPDARDASSAALNRAKLFKMMLASSDYAFPSGTTTTTNWTFNLCKNGKTVCFFDWIDFRGGYFDHLNDGVGGANEEEMKEILTYVAASDAVIVFIDSFRAIHFSGNKNSAWQFTKAAGIFHFLRDVAKDNPNRTFIIVGTKADSDKIDRKYQDNNFSELNELLGKIYFDLYYPLFDYGWKGAITSVGAIGLGNVKSNVAQNGPAFREAPTVITEIVGFPSPINVEVPLLYCLLQELRKNKDLGRESILTKESALSRAKAETNLWNNLVAKVANVTTPAERANELTKILLEEKEILRSFEFAIPEIERIIRMKVKVLCP